MSQNLLSDLRTTRGIARLFPVKILVVAPLDCPHVARWLADLRDLEHKVFFFPWFAEAKSAWAPLRKLERLGRGFDNISVLCDTPEGSTRRNFQKFLNQIRPDVVHSFRLAGPSEFVLQARRSFLKNTRWIVSSQGSDLTHLLYLGNNKSLSRQILRHADLFISECHRDFALAKKLGYHKSLLGPLPQAGGIPASQFKRVRTMPPPSQRKWVLIKAYQNSIGRASVGLMALLRVKELLTGYRVGLYGATPGAVNTLVHSLANSGIKATVLPTLSWDQHMARHQKARVSIGLSVCDGISMSLLEAMAGGAFPIQSHTAETRGWIIPNKTGILVDPETPSEVAKALSTALQNDQLVDEAAIRNQLVIQKKFSHPVQLQKIQRVYEHVRNS